LADSRWDEWAKDPYYYTEFVKAVLGHYSGREELGEATVEDLRKMIGEYIHSDDFKKMEEAHKHNAEATKFMKELGGL
jgi:hypothetical protein